MEIISVVPNYKWCSVWLRCHKGHAPIQCWRFVFSPVLGVATFHTFQSIMIFCRMGEILRKCKYCDDAVFCFSCQQITHYFLSARIINKSKEQGKELLSDSFHKYFWQQKMFQSQTSDFNEHFQFFLKCQNKLFYL